MSKTTSFQRLGTAGLAALAVVGLLSGCAAKKKTAASTSGSTASAAAAASNAPAAPAASATAALPSPSKVVATGGGKFCQEVASEINTADKSNSGGTGADSMKASVQAFQSIEGTVIKSAPNAIRPDLVTLFGALDQFYGALAKANYDVTKVDPGVEAPLETPAVQKAEANVDAYLKNTCGIDTGDDTGSSAEAQASAAEASALAELSALASPSS